MRKSLRNCIYQRNMPNENFNFISYRDICNSISQPVIAICACVDVSDFNYELSKCFQWKFYTSFEIQWKNSKSFWKCKQYAYWISTMWNLHSPPLPYYSSIKSVIDIMKSWSEAGSVTPWKVSKYKVLSGPNTGKHGSEKTPYLNTFHVMQRIH